MANGSSSQPEPWILICGGFHTRGGMDRANFALAERLIELGHSVHLVGHNIDDAIANRTGVTAIRVPKPLESIALGEGRLIRSAREVAHKVKVSRPNAIVVANGGNGIAADVNWIHYVHRASGFEDAGAPVGVRLKNRIAEQIFLRHERQCVQSARLVIANSELTRRHVVELLGIEEQRTTTIYLGANNDWEPATKAERSAARSWLEILENEPVVSFVGALGHDRRKGFDTLWAAWQELTADPAWNAHLVVAGGGRQVEHWRRMAQVNPRVHILGFTDRVRDLLAASDLLVSPAMYEPFGLNVMEAICRGVPAIVSADAGVAELYPAEIRRFQLANPRDHRALAKMLREWHQAIERARTEFAPLGSVLRKRSWQAMADEMIHAVHQALRRSPGNTLVATQ